MATQTMLLEFDNAAERTEHLRMLGYRRLPTKTPIRRWTANLTGDDGERIISFARASGDKDLHVVDYYPAKKEVHRS